MTTRRQRTYDVSALLVLALLFVAVVMISNTLFRGLQWDLTENKLYTISQGTQNILSSLNDQQNLYFFFSEESSRDVPAIRTYANRVREMLEEFAAASNGKIRLRVIDPAPFSEEEDMANEFGLTPVPIGPNSESVYFGLAGTNMVDDASTIAFFHPDKEQFLEYDLAKLVYSLEHPERPVLGLISSLPMQRDFDPMSQQMRQAWVVADQAEQLFQIRTLQTDLTRVDDDIDLLVIVHPKALSETSLYAIDQFLMGGGHALVFVDPVAESDMSGADPADPFGAQAGNRASNLGPLFSAWGVRYNPGEVVGDQQLALSVSMGGGRPSVRHLAFLGFRSDNMDPADPVTAKLDLINAASAGYFSLSEDSALELTPLLQTSEQAMPLTADRFQFLPDPAALQNGFQPSGQRYIVAARLSGRFPSAFPDGAPATEGVDQQTGATPHLSQSQADSAVILVADTDLLTDRFWVQVQNFLGQRLANTFANNGDFVINALDNLAGSSDLISIRGRAGYTRPFARVEQLRREAEARLQSKEQELEQQLQATEDNLVRLQSQRPDQDALLLTDEQSQEIRRFLDEKVRIRKELRQVRRDLDQDIERLGGVLKFVNIALVPLLLTMGLLGWISLSMRRKRR